MKEILGDCLFKFIIEMSNRKDYEKHQRTYKGRGYEVWEVSDDLFEDMCDMSEEEFFKLAGDEAWWRYSEGSNMWSPDVEWEINNQKIFAWDSNRRDEYEFECENCSDRESGTCEGTKEDFEDCFGAREYLKLTEYLCEEIGASQPRNVCALATDLAKYNNMTLGELFTKYEG